MSGVSTDRVNGSVTTRGTSKVGPAQVLDANFLPTQTAHVTALMIGAFPAALAPAVRSVEALKA